MSGLLAVPATVPVMDETVYTSITGAAPPANFDDLVDRVVDRLEAALDRPLRVAERTERCRVYSDGVAYPKSTPIIEVDGFTDFDTVSVSTGQRSGWVLVTYTGGLLDDGDGPADLLAAVAWGVHTLAAPTVSTVNDGVQALNIAGEYSITRTPGTVVGADGEMVPHALVSIADLGGRCASLAVRYRRV